MLAADWSSWVWSHGSIAHVVLKHIYTKACWQLIGHHGCDHMVVLHIDRTDPFNAAFLVKLLMIYEQAFVLANDAGK